MFKTVRDVLIGAIVAAMVSGALAVVGTPPGTGFQLVDGVWLNGLAGGVNYLFQNGLTATGTNQATALQLAPGVMMYEIDTVASSTGVALPECVAGAQFDLRNAGANTLSIYGSVTVNSLTGANDTINGTAGSTAYTITANTNATFFCAKNGNWSAGKIS